MTNIEKDREARKQTRLDKLDTNNPVCVTCGENKWQCMEQHHIAGKAYDGDMCNVCRNCHRILSDDQIDHPKPIGKPATTPEIIGHYLIGLADLFELIVGKIREFGHALIEMARVGVQAS